MVWQAVVPGSAASAADNGTAFRVQADDPAGLVAHILGSTEQVWSVIMATLQTDYHYPKLVLYSRATQSDCGLVTSDGGPRYCAVDERIYLDPARERNL
jgi:predicted metalloprotease